MCAVCVFVRRKKRYGHVSRSSSLANITLQSAVKGGRRQGKQKQQQQKRGRKTTSDLDRPGVLQVPEGSGEQRKMEGIGCEVICGALTTRAIKR